ncbi:hypothetical protein DPMN_008414 [Dreissena polymorpha]|uniref:Uncharacterized protein n=1 Tax=Dreissena polymorpha TaxID=45954 RepID=A0A9D4MXQ4_DREPO|nr:hypothetical protein DPMN_008414 [Dreissena polymorpha]
MIESGTSGIGGEVAEKCENPRSNLMGSTLADRMLRSLQIERDTTSYRKTACYGQKCNIRRILRGKNCSSNKIVFNQGILKMEREDEVPPDP